jgi:D-psicose/D-tagatose/L-ribulose 3-epimerase
MKVGMNLFLWTDAVQYDKHRHLLDLIKGMGFVGVEFPVETMNVKDIEKFSAACDSIGLGRTAVAVFNPALYDPISPDASLRKAAVRAIGEWSEKTKMLGADLLGGPFFQGLGRLSGASPTEDEWKRALDTLHEGCSIAAANGIRIALEPLNRFEMYFVNTIAGAQRFIKELGLPNVGILGDTMHANIEELDVAGAYCGAMPHLFHVHISESNRGTPGSGHGVPAALFSGLKAAGYDGWLTIEAFHGGSTPSMIPALCLWKSCEDTPEEMARKGLEFIRSKI